MRCNRWRFGATAGMLPALICLLASSAPAFSQDSTDWITGLPRAPIHVQAWPGGKKVAVCFVLDVEVWGHGQGPNFRSDMGGRDPDIVDESFRQYAIDWGIP
ncbi:MAG: polysaccharide deacetylase, partial [Dongiales bacterium]